MTGPPEEGKAFVCSVKGSVHPKRALRPAAASSSLTFSSSASAFLSACLPAGASAAAAGAAATGGSNRGLRDGFFDVDSLEGSNECLDFRGVNFYACCLEDSRDGFFRDRLSSRVENHCAVNILHFIQLLYPNRALRPAAASSSVCSSLFSSAFCSAFLAGSAAATGAEAAQALSLAAMSSLVNPDAEARASI